MKSEAETTTTIKRIETAGVDEIHFKKKRTTFITVFSTNLKKKKEQFNKPKEYHNNQKNNLLNKTKVLKYKTNKQIKQKQINKKS